MKVNTDYIASVILNANGQLEYRETPIKKNNQEILDQMKDMVGNPNRSLLDLQEKAASLIISKDQHNVCIPYEYNASYIHAPEMPEDISFEQYTRKCNEEKESLLAEKEEKEKEGEAFDVDKAYSNFIFDLKKKYFEAVCDYVTADEYIAALRLIKTDSRQLMYSTENIGWTTFNYPISDAVKFEVKTNFGYGRSAHFRVNLTYKGIQIIPYSDIVNYFFAKVKEVGQFTRQYRAVHGSWPIALKFVTDTSNLASSNPEKFVETWIKNELEEMMQGLRRLRQDPNKEIHRFENATSDVAEHYVCVRNIMDEDVKDLKSFPQEFPIYYKAYKISGALNFLENMKQLAALYDFVSDYIDELKQINISILPEVDTVIASIEASIVELNRKHDALRANLEAIEKKIQPFRDTLEGLKAGKDYFEQQKITQSFKSMNPIYVKLLGEILGLNQELYKLSQLIVKRENFKTSLEESRTLILEVAAA